MTLELSNSPGKPDIKTWFDDIVHINTSEAEIEITMKDFMAAAYYVLTNNYLVPNDPRLTFVKIVKRMQPSPNGKQFLYRDKECFSLGYPGDYLSETLD